MWILDTDHLSLWQRGYPLVSQRIAAIDPLMLGVTIVTLEEQLRGRLHTIRQAASDQELRLAYANLGKTYFFFRNLNLLAFDEVASHHYANLKQQRIRVGSQDLKIAAIALAANATVVTRNQRDFSQVPGLLLADWSG
jgi:tRNA(fMet)-specific endonuclease VapC